MLKTHPNISHEIFDFFREKNYSVVLEGTGLGHAPIDMTDEMTKESGEIKKSLEKLAKQTIVCIVSQCLYGRVNLNVYSNGRELQKIGVLPLADMLPETAFVKLAWALGQTKDPKEVRELMTKNIVGEFSERSDVRHEVGMD